MMVASGNTGSSSSYSQGQNLRHVVMKEPCQATDQSPATGKGDLLSLMKALVGDPSTASTDDWGFDKLDAIRLGRPLPPSVNARLLALLAKQTAEAGSASAEDQDRRENLHLFTLALQAALALRSGASESRLQACTNLLADVVDGLESREGGFSHAGVAAVCAVHGDLLCALDKPLEAVDMFERSQPLVEAQCVNKRALAVLLRHGVRWWEEVDKCGEGSVGYMAFRGVEAPRGPSLRRRQALALKALAVAEQASLTPKKFVEFLLLAARQLDLTNPSRALPYAVRALEMSKAVNFIKASTVAALCYQHLGRIPEAETVIRTGVRYSEDNDLPAGLELLQAFGVLVHILREAGRYKEALAYALKAHAVTERCGLSGCGTIELVADIYEEVGLLQKALKIDRAEYRTRSVSASMAYRLGQAAVDAGKLLQAEAILMFDTDSFMRPFHHFDESKLDPLTPTILRPVELLADLLERKDSVEATLDAEELRGVIAAWQNADVGRRERALSEAVAAFRAEGRSADGLRKEDEHLSVPEEGSDGADGSSGGGASVAERPGRTRAARRQRTWGELEEPVGDSDSGDKQAATSPDEVNELGLGVIGLGKVGVEAQERLLKCGHGFQDRFLDIWSDKCQELRVLLTCPACQKALVRV